MKFFAVFIKIVFVFMKLARDYMNIVSVFMKLATVYMNIVRVFMKLVRDYKNVVFVFVKFARDYMNIAPVFMKLAAVFVNIAFIFMKLAATFIEPVAVLKREKKKSAAMAAVLRSASFSKDVFNTQFHPSLRFPIKRARAHFRNFQAQTDFMETHFIHIAEFERKAVVW